MFEPHRANLCYPYKLHWVKSTKNTWMRTILNQVYLTWKCCSYLLTCSGVAFPPGVHATDYSVTTAHLPEFKSTSAARARLGVSGDLEAYSGLLDQSPKSHVTKSLLKTCFQSTGSLGWFTWHWCVHQLRFVTWDNTYVRHGHQKHRKHKFVGSTSVFDAEST